MTQEQYDLKTLKLPRLAGTTLALVTWLVEHPATRWLVAGSLFENGGINKMRSLEISDPPTFEPQPPPALESTEVPFRPEVTFRRDASAALQLGIQSVVEAETHRDGFPFTTILDFAQAYQQGHTTPVLVAERVLAAIETSNTHQPPLRAIIESRSEDVLSQARTSADRIRSGQALSILDGVPVAIKDEFDMLNYATNGGTCFMGKAPALQDATAVARLRAAGALLIGKANMHEIGIGVTGFNQHYGTARNPYNLDYHTGGSSSGPAAAVASGLSPLALGADGGGSIRVPAGLCGVVGLKPTFGRVSEFGAVPSNWSVAHIGPLGATAQDAAIGYAIVAGPDPCDPHTLRQPGTSLADFSRRDLTDLTLGVYWPWFRHASAEIVEACELALQRFQELGAKIREITIPDLDPLRVAHMVTITSEMANGLEQEYLQSCQKFSLEVSYDLALARMFTARDYLQAQRIRTRIIRHFEQAFLQVDAIITPTSAITAPLIRADALARGESDISVLTEIMRFVLSSNFTGHPAISFPIEYNAQGLPIGLQAIGRYWEEALLLRLANTYEPFLQRRKPSMYFDLL